VVDFRVEDHRRDTGAARSGRQRGHRERSSCSARSW
jgi:hypothetical protein